MSVLPDPGDQTSFDPQGRDVVGESCDRSQMAPDTQSDAVPVAPIPAEPKDAPMSIGFAARLDYSLLALLAAALDDLESTRKALSNRLHDLTHNKEFPKLGISRPAPLPGDDPIVERLQATIDGVAALEHGAVLELQRAMRKHPLGPWVQGTIGIGLKQGARLLAATGDPYWNTLHDRPRTVSELWAYCGYHVLHPGHLRPDDHTSPAGVDPSSDAGHSPRDAHGEAAGVAPSRSKGQRANWSNEAKMRAYLVAVSCVQQWTSPYRRTYDAGREKYAEAVHATPCKRCGPAGKPAPIGSPLSDGHKHARALRLVAKTILYDLWSESRRLHWNVDIQRRPESPDSDQPTDGAA